MMVMHNLPEAQEFFVEWRSLNDFEQQKASRMLSFLVEYDVDDYPDPFPFVPRNPKFERIIDLFNVLKHCLPQSGDRSIADS